MKKQRSGSIITTASTAGLRNDPYTPYSYTIAKAGVVNFTRQAAHDLARWGVRVNAIAPGPFKTNLDGGALLQGPSRPDPHPKEPNPPTPTSRNQPNAAYFRGRPPRP